MNIFWNYSFLPSSKVKSKFLSFDWNILSWSPYLFLSLPKLFLTLKLKLSFGNADVFMHFLYSQSINTHVSPGFHDSAWLGHFLGSSNTSSRSFLSTCQGPHYRNAFALSLELHNFTRKYEITAFSNLSSHIVNIHEIFDYVFCHHPYWI